MFDDLLNPYNVGVGIEMTQRKKHELRYEGSQRKVRGHITYSYNTETGEIKAAEIKHCNTISFETLEPLYSPKIIMEKNCIYRQALNVNNLKKRLKKEGYTLFI